ncbi:hypothetical protein GCM10007852_38180 [Agaribacter marinus]|uniref:Uncharacterized protein n=1 Tax=Agaribacter marinus TaxID=1431249 RepID=A0AA37T7G3_9ALTE|nr:hypothetical protein GCM10007852_38180 [Agaribacter marinus]
MSVIDKHNKVFHSLHIYDGINCANFSISNKLADIFVKKVISADDIMQKNHYTALRFAAWLNSLSQKSIQLTEREQSSSRRKRELKSFNVPL